MPTLERLIIPGRPRPWVIGHRGASDVAPENSAAGFRTAIEAGVDLIEADLRLSADGQIVCFNDETLKRMTGDARRVSDLTAAELRRFRLISKNDIRDQKIAPLEELLELTSLGVILELKDPRFAERRHVLRLLEVLGDRVEATRVAVISRDLRLLRAVKVFAPTLVTGHISLTNPFGNTDTDLLGPYWPLLRINPRYIQQAHRRGQRVCPLDYDLHRRISDYFDANVDAVLSSHPELTVARLEQLRRETQGEEFY